MALLLVNCSSSTEPNDNLLSINKNDNHLTISNNNSETAYILVVEQEMAALIDWVAHFDDPKVLANSSTNIYYENISGLNQPFNSGDKVIVYWWYKSDETTPMIFNKVVEL